MKKKLRILALVREGLVPPDSLGEYDDENPPEWKVEFDVVMTLKEMGHEVMVVGVFDDLSPIRRAILDWKPDIAFMLLEEFHGVATYDQAIASYLELMRQPYTGCNPRGLLLSHDKALSKKILAYHHIPTPRFTTFPQGKKIRPSRRMKYPIIVKSLTEDASLGISQKSIVHHDEALVERVRFVHDHIGTAALCEEYIDGRELYCGVIGNDRLQALPVWEMTFDRMPRDTARIATARVKWNTRYRTKYGIETGPAVLEKSVEAKVQRLSKKVYQVLNMNGYARIDFRLTDSGQVFVLEANSNPNLEYGEDLAESAHQAGMTYEKLLRKILSLGLSYRAPWAQYLS